MSLATRCPACSTTFRVVQDQLKVSDGWVRCGQCQEVFNALETLFELPVAPVAPAAGPPPAPPSTARPTPDSFTDIDLAESPPPASAEAAWPADSAADPPAPEDVHAEGQEGPGDAYAEAAVGRPTAPLAPTDDADSQTGPVAMASAAGAQGASDAAPPDPVARPEEDARPEETAAEPTESAAPGTNTDGAWSRDDDAAPNREAADVQALLGAASDGGALPVTAVEDEPESQRSAAPPAPDASSEPADQAAESGAPAWTMSPEARWERKRRRRARPPAAPQAVANRDSTTGAELAAPATKSRRRKPEFMRRVERAAHWQRPAVRAVLGSATAALLLLLCGQVGLAFRDDLAARWPQLAGPLAQACRPLGCEVAAPRSLEHLVIDSSQLSRTAWPDTLRLTAELRNTASHAVRAPALELRFTDPNGRTLVRKVLLPTELSASAASAPLAIGADDSWQVDALLAVGPLKVSGFSAEVFYP